MRFLFQLQFFQQVVDDVLVRTAAITKQSSMFYTAELECLAVLKVRNSRPRVGRAVYTVEMPTKDLIQLSLLPSSGFLVCAVLTTAYLCVLPAGVSVILDQWDFILNNYPCNTFFYK